MFSNINNFFKFKKKLGHKETEFNHLIDKINDLSKKGISYDTTFNQLQDYLSLMENEHELSVTQKQEKIKSINEKKEKEQFEIKKEQHYQKSVTELTNFFMGKFPKFRMISSSTLVYINKWLNKMVLIKDCLMF